MCTHLLHACILTYVRMVHFYAYAFDTVHVVLQHGQYEGPEFREYLQRSTEGPQAAQIRFQLRSGTSMLRQHDSRFRDQPSHDTEDRICPACKETDSIESIHHVLLHCPAYEHRRAALRTAIACLPAAQASPPVLHDDEGVIAILRDDFMGGTEEQLLQ